MQKLAATHLAHKAAWLSHSIASYVATLAVAILKHS